VSPDGEFPPAHQVEIDVRGSRLAGSVVDLPFVRR
jgi:hypothetical protein